MNILSITSLADQFNNDDGAGINTKRSKSHFYWNHNKHQGTITHPPSNLTEMPVNEGFSLARMYTQMVGAKVFTTKQHCHFHASTLIPNDDDPKRNVELSFDMFHVGETLIYTNAGQTLYVQIEEISLDKKAALQFLVRNTNNEVIETTRESLRSPDHPDIGWIPTMLPEKKEAVSNLTEKDIDNITNPVSLTIVGGIRISP